MNIAYNDKVESISTYIDKQLKIIFLTIIVICGFILLLKLGISILARTKSLVVLFSHFNNFI